MGKNRNFLKRINVKLSPSKSKFTSGSFQNCNLPTGLRVVFFFLVIFLKFCFKIFIINKKRLSTVYLSLNYFSKIHVKVVIFCSPPPKKKKKKLRKNLLAHLPITTPKYWADADFLGEPFWNLNQFDKLACQIKSVNTKTTKNKF